MIGLSFGAKRILMPMEKKDDLYYGKQKKLIEIGKAQ